MEKPKKRSPLRLLLGRIFFTLKRFIYWHFSRTDFAEEISKDALPAEIFTHKTVLRRKLKDVDMWMQENKIINLKIAVKKMDGLLIKPGQTFSYWRLLGNPTKKKGYLKGMILHNGKVMEGIGGGICQLSNLIYWMTLHTPLTITERHRHSYDVFPDVKRKQPFGSGATCAYPNIDLQFKNETDQTFRLSLKVTDKYLEGAWLSTKPIPYKYEIIEKDHEIRHEWWGKYTRNNKIFRKTIDKKSNKSINEKLITENHAIMMYNPLIADQK